MEKPFDIFWFGDSGPTWIDAVTTLEIAKVRIETLPQPNSGSYGVLDQRTGRHISFVPRSKNTENSNEESEADRSSLTRWINLNGTKRNT